MLGGGVVTTTYYRIRSKIPNNITSSNAYLLGKNNNNKISTQIDSSTFILINIMEFFGGYSDKHFFNVVFISLLD